MKKVTFLDIWKNSPNEKKIMVSNFIQYCIPYIKKYNLKTFLDAGCGNGLGATLPLSRLGCNVHAFDFTPEGVKACKDNLKQEGFKPAVKNGDMYKKFPFNNIFFNAVICFQAIFHGRLEQIMFTLSEIKRVLNKKGIFFGSFLCYENIYFDQQRKLHYLWVKSEGKKFKSWLRQDKSEPHLFYNLSKNYEYNIPHYYMSKDELKCILKQYFEDITIKLVQKNNSNLWFVICKK